MEIKVFWTQTALNNLEDIFEYYKFRASVNVARNIVKDIVSSTIRIQNSPKIGKTEDLLKKRDLEYRFIVVRNYKIVYWLEGGYIKIATVFDTRQDPDKIKRTRY